MSIRYDQLNLRDAADVVSILQQACAANLTARCRRGSIDVVTPTDGTSRRLIATGDLHDNPVHLSRLVHAAGLAADESTSHPGSSTPLAHLTLHEVIHGGRLVNDMDFSFRALVRVAALKIAHPEHVHTLLANHELAQIVGAGIVKDGLNVVRAFNDAVEFTFGDDSKDVQAAIGAFIRSMPLALVCTGGRDDGTLGTGGVLCSHSLPAPELMDRFDPTVLTRELVEDDYTPRRGSAHLMVWGRGHEPAQLELLAREWGVSLFVLGHEKADDGVLVVPPNVVVLNSDHEQGRLLEIDLDTTMSASDASSLAKPISEG